MEHLYQPEEGIFSANYETFKEYYTNPHLTPAHHPPKGTKLLDHLIPDDANNLIHPTMSNASLPQAPGNSALDAYFHMSWNVVHMASQQPHCVWVRSPPSSFKIFHTIFRVVKVRRDSIFRDSRG